MDEKITLSIQNPEGVLISYVDIYFGDKNVSLEVLSNDTAKINLPFEKDNGEGEIIVKIKYKTLPNHKSKKENKKQNYITQSTKTPKPNNDMIVADSEPISLDDVKREEKRKKTSDIIIL
ncbi:hypothetical protein [Methanocaldococcus fervens]|uniref:Uncharacterized protein n=1 Tax=Methanocaldococcus fervens (strain DSM 4213 / JCM 15782 / AG86) TaxID=573064 RepID=C7P815_METFA|nr:hypothetical protein [Methanocaldococcus fervens]ACV24697.1 hypothetical protein Mefer_0879 [Methanocaldococcus fervens AG86]